MRVFEWTLQREPGVGKSTPGVLSCGGRWWYTLEDQVREQAGVPVATWKVHGETAIPAGRYRVVLSMSNRFGRLLPEVQNVPGFVGIRWHAGNAIDDTDGCQLVGLTRGKGWVGKSRAAEAQVVRALSEVGEHYVTIRNAPVGAQEV